MTETPPELARLQGELYRSLWRQEYLPPQTLELCRLRLAQLHRCEQESRRSDWDVADGKRAELAAWPGDPQFSAAERACLEFTELYAMDVLAISDEQAAAVQAHFGDAGLVMLIEALGIFDGKTRLALLWNTEATQGGV